MDFGWRDFLWKALGNCFHGDEMPSSKSHKNLRSPFLFCVQHATLDHSSASLTFIGKSSGDSIRPMTCEFSVTSGGRKWSTEPATQTWSILRPILGLTKQCSVPNTGKEVMAPRSRHFEWCTSLLPSMRHWACCRNRISWQGQDVFSICVQHKTLNHAMGRKRF